MNHAVGKSEMRMRRAAAICMAVTTLIVPAVLFAVEKGLLVLVADWWTPVSLALVIGAALALMAAAVESTGKWIGLAALVLGAANAIAMVLWLCAWTGVELPDSIGSPPIWPANTVVLPSIVMATVYRARVAVIYLGLVLVLLGTAQQFSKEGALGLLGYTNGLLTASLVGVLLTAEIAVMDAVRTSDRRRAEVLSLAARAAGRAARIAESMRLDIVVRDEVIAVLRTVNEGRPDLRYQGKAQCALTKLDGRSATEETPPDLTASETVLRLREAINELGDDTLVDVELLDPEVRYPYPLGEALVDAAVEAVTNAVQHAGPSASRALIGAFGGDLIRLRIVDDGVGFDPRRVAPDRAGIELGIRERVQSQPGGDAWVESEHGEGTMVSLQWSRS